MRWTRNVLLALAVAACVHGSARAQFFLSELGRGSGPSQLLLRPEVQEELKLTAEQIKRVNQINAEIRKDLASNFDVLSELDGRERDRKKMELAKNIKKRARSFVKEILDDKQQKRLDEIALQAAGVLGFKEEEVQDALALTGDQKKSLQELMQGAIQQMQVLFRKSSEQYEEAQKQAGVLRKETYVNALKLITDEQRVKWDQMRGQRFVFRVAEERAANPLALKGEIELGPDASPNEDRASLSWVDARAEKWQPKKEEKRFDEIGWAETDILNGLKIAKKNNRALFVFMVDGYSHRGRC
jgi:hypothetical protein